jgi:hypothetical protein
LLASSSATELPSRKVWEQTQFISLANLKQLEMLRYQGTTIFCLKALTTSHKSVLIKILLQLIILASFLNGIHTSTKISCESHNITNILHKSTLEVGVIISENYTYSNNKRILESRAIYVCFCPVNLRRPPN